MRKFREYKTIAFILLILFLLFCAFWNWKINSKSLSVISDLPAPHEESQNSDIKNIQISKTTASTEKLIENKSYINVNFKINEQLFTLSIPQESSLYEALVLAQEKKLTTFSGKEYGALGFFVSDIGDMHSGEGNYLIYYINGKEASVGVSSYELKDGDTIEWKLE